MNCHLMRIIKYAVWGNKITPPSPPLLHSYIKMGVKIVKIMLPHPVKVHSQTSLTGVLAKYEMHIDIRDISKNYVVNLSMY